MASRRCSGLAVLLVLGLCLVARNGAAAPQATTGAATTVTATAAGSEALPQQ